MKNSMQPQRLVPKSPDLSHHSCPDLVPVMTTIGVDPEIATTTTRLRTFLHYVHMYAARWCVIICVKWCVLHVVLHEHIIYANFK